MATSLTTVQGSSLAIPIFNLDHYFTDIHKYLRYLEEAIILTLAEYGLEGDRSPGETGVWLDVGKPTARKICAMGVRASRWVTMHGFAFQHQHQPETFWLTSCRVAFVIKL